MYGTKKPAKKSTKNTKNTKKKGTKKFRYNVKNKTEVKETQSDLSNFVNKFVGEGE